MKFEELQNEVREICQPIIDAYDGVVAEFHKKEEASGLVSAIHWRSDDVATAHGRKQEAQRWLTSFERADVSTFMPDACLEAIQEDYRFIYTLNNSTSPFSNAVADYQAIGKQSFIRGYITSPLQLIEKAVRKYQEAQNV